MRIKKWVNVLSAKFQRDAAYYTNYIIEKFNHDVHGDFPKTILFEWHVNMTGKLIKAQAYFSRLYAKPYLLFLVLDDVLNLDNEVADQKNVAPKPSILTLSKGTRQFKAPRTKNEISICKFVPGDFRFVFYPLKYWILRLCVGCVST